MLIAAVALVAMAIGGSVRPLPLLAAVPLIGSLSSAHNVRLAMEQLGPLSGLDDFGLNRASVAWLEGFIECQRIHPNIVQDPGGLVGLLGSFLGECMAANADGAWHHSDEHCWCVGAAEAVVVLDQKRGGVGATVVDRPWGTEMLAGRREVLRGDAERRGRLVDHAAVVVEVDGPPSLGRVVGEQPAIHRRIVAPVTSPGVLHTTPLRDAPVALQSSRLNSASVRWTTVSVASAS